ncbi:MbtH family protein [Nocardia terpenica]|uniref:MbtH family NRPS accessory protein n=1 Tax=Nocardia terpenica TaxID=455432 RepID=A0A6G9Z704_9NOCA|nr:MbtH family NRPS accessory protein [Nocardia terpenica]QIS21224.1 MbtH family NRPS accessory protein [Nocardia terpenica]
MTDSPQYAVVRNDEEQYSIWRVDRALPDGWVREGTVGSKDECLDHIERIWTDMRPRSVRTQFDEAVANRPERG